VDGDAGYRWSAQVRNVSAQGVALLISRRFELGTVLSVELEATRESPSRTLLARVVRLRPQADGKWEVGCTLVEKFSDQQARSLR
jgi:hypothetical protein